MPIENLDLYFSLATGQYAWLVIYRSVTGLTSHCHTSLVVVMNTWSSTSNACTELIDSSCPSSLLSRAFKWTGESAHSVQGAAAASYAKAGEPAGPNNGKGANHERVGFCGGEEAVTLNEHRHREEKRNSTENGRFGLLVSHGEVGFNYVDQVW